MTLVGEGSGGYSDETGPGRSSYSAISYAAAMRVVLRCQEPYKLFGQDLQLRWIIPESDYLRQFA
jgi:hypothetical protein